MEHELNHPPVSLTLHCSGCCENETVSARTIAELGPMFYSLAFAGWVVRSPFKCPSCARLQAGTIRVNHQLTEPQLAELKDWWTHGQYAGCPLPPPPRPSASDSPFVRFAPPLLPALTRALAMPWRAIAGALRALFAPREPAARRRLADERLLRQINGGRGL